MTKEWKIVEEFVHAGIRCFIVKYKVGTRDDYDRANFGEDGYYQYNGYVILPKGHKDYAVVDEYEYKFIEEHLINKDDIQKYKIGKPTQYRVHGGITFRDFGRRGIYPIGEWIIGFDTAHSGDFAFDGWKKGIDYVHEETKQLAKQVSARWG